MKSIVMFVLAVAMVYFMVKPGEAVQCGQVAASLASCMPYLEAAGQNPSTACCDGVRNIKAITPTTADRQAACECVKSAAAKHPNINQDAASSVPGKCGVPLNIPISPYTNCAKIN
ncbi:non-specific lipid-transfer protein A-like [Pistacia vera]|uniref:non-specific lipid-transfer protein A-like n=1 Tax=Pistacia vera TaxID=55513 RepID=UPI001263D5E8|nr:non-specific lipid-transfer protein A-like [Pistacia vera]